MTNLTVGNITFSSNIVKPLDIKRQPKSSINISLDSSEFKKAVSELELNIPQRFSEIGELSFNFSDFFLECFSFKHKSTEGASVVVSLEPTDSFFDFLSAVRASDFNNHIIKRFFHNKSPSRSKAGNDDSNLDAQINNNPAIGGVR